MCLVIAKVATAALQPKKKRRTKKKSQWKSSVNKNRHFTILFNHRSLLISMTFDFYLFSSISRFLLNIFILTFFFVILSDYIESKLTCKKKTKAIRMKRTERKREKEETKVEAKIKRIHRTLDINHLFDKSIDECTFRQMDLTPDEFQQQKRFFFVH